MHREAVRGVQVQDERDDQPDAERPQQQRARQQVAGHVAQRFAVEVDLLLREEELEVADQVDERRSP